MWSYLLAVFLPLFVLCITLSIRIVTTEDEIAYKNYSRILKLSEQEINGLFNGVIDDTNFVAQMDLLIAADNSITTYYQNSQKTPMTPILNGGIEAELFKFFELIIETHPSYSYAYFGHKEGGFVMYPTSDRKPGYNPSERSWYKSAFTDPDQTVIADVYETSDGTSIVVSPVHTVRNSSGDIVGVFGFDITLNSITDSIQNIVLGESGHVILIDDN